MPEDKQLHNTILPNSDPLYILNKYRVMDLCLLLLSFLKVLILEICLPKTDSLVLLTVQC